MRFTETDLIGAWVIDATPHQDERGRFMRAWCAREFVEPGINFSPVQGNMEISDSASRPRGNSTSSNETTSSFAVAGTELTLAA